jgi:WD40 repeat protein
VVRAVVAAHARGILHRDLKPANVLLTSDGTPKVADFGLAKLVGSDDGATATGAAMGTPPYMAPEQVRDAKAVGPPADVYGLGAVLYECLTGRPPFKGATVADTLNQVLTQEPVGVRVLNPQVPVDLETVTLKCLEKDPARRYESASSLANDLRAFLEGRPVVARPVGPLGRAWRWRKRNPGLAVAVGAAVLALVVGSVASTGFGLLALDEAKRADDNLIRARDEAKEKEQETARAEAETTKAKNEADNARRSAEAEKMAVRKGQQLLGLMSASEGVKLADEGQLSLGLLKMANALVVAPESPEAEAMSRAQCALYQRHSRPAYTLRHLFSPATAVKSVVFSPAGRRVLTGSQDNTAQVWDSNTGKPLGPPLQHARVVTSVAFSPDGRRILTGSGDNTARVWDAESGTPLGPSLQHTSAVVSVAFSPDGRRVLTRNWDNTAQVWDANTGKTVGLSLGHVSSVVSVAFSPDGQRVLTGSWDNTAQVWDTNTGKTVAPPRQHASPVVSVAFSPDGQQVLTGSWDNTAQVWDANTGKTVGQPLKHASPVVSVAFSPDGRRVLTGSRDNTARLWDTNTGKPLAPPLQHAKSVVSVTFNPNGRQLLTTCGDGTAWLWEANTGKPRAPSLEHAGSVMSVVFSLDGRRVLTRGMDGTAQVWDVDSGKALSPPLPRAVLAPPEPKPPPRKMPKTPSWFTIADLTTVPPVFSLADLILVQDLQSPPVLPPPVQPPPVQPPPVQPPPIQSSPVQPAPGEGPPTSNWGADSTPRAPQSPAGSPRSEVTMAFSWDGRRILIGSHHSARASANFG